MGYAPAQYACPTGYTQLLSGGKYRYYIESGAAAGWDAIVARIEEEEQPVPFEAHDATVYVKADFTPVYFYIWDSNSNTQLNGSWPGKRVDNNTAYQTTIGGETWLKQTVTITSADYYYNIIFNQGSGKPQTADITRITSDRYFTATLSGGAVAYEDVTSQYVGIENPIVENAYSSNSMRTFDLLGRPVTDTQQGGFVVKNGKICLQK